MRYTSFRKAGPQSYQVAWLYGAGRNEDAYGANLKWTNDHELVIEYLKARSNDCNEQA
jgi:hypothetical protein